MQGNIHGGKQLGKDKKRVTVCVSEELYNKLLNLAKEQEKTVSDLVRDAVKERLARSGA